MNKIYKKYLEWKLKRTNAKIDNTKKIKTQVMVNGMGYNRYHVKQLFLISKKSYLENKLTYE